MVFTKDKPIQVAQLFGTDREPNPSGGRVYSVDGIMRTLGHGNGMSQPYIAIKQVAQLYGTDREPNPQAGRVYDADGIPPTLDTCSGGNRMPKIIRREKVSNNGSADIGVVDIDGEKVMVRRLTPKECFRLQGFPDDYFERAASVNSDSQLYKQAGNSVTVNVIYEIAKRLK